VGADVLVAVDSLDAYFNFDPVRKKDLVALDKTIRLSAPSLRRFFHTGTPLGEPGMRFKMIGYGKFHYPSRSGKSISWPVIRVALQKNYISVYLSVTVGDKPIIDAYIGKLGELRSGINSFSFQSFDELQPVALATLCSLAALVFKSAPDNPVKAKCGL
jgi:hypothetical protein